MSSRHPATTVLLVLSFLVVGLLALDVTSYGEFSRSEPAFGAPTESSTQAPGEHKTSATPHVSSLVMVEPSTLDAGIVRRGEIAHFQFTVRNRNNFPLEISVKPACGCTLTKYDQQIAPGESGKIEAELRTQGLAGRVTKSIDVVTNDPDQPRLQLKLTADVRERIQAKLPPGGTFYPARGETSIERFPVQVETSETLNIISASTSVPHVRATLREVSSKVDNFRDYEVDLEFSPDTPPGALLIRPLSDHRQP